MKPVKCSAIIYCSTRTMQSCPRLFSFQTIFLAIVNIVLLMSFSTYSGTPLIWSPYSFCFENYIPAGKAKRKESLVQTFYKMSSAHFFDWLIFAESANQSNITPVACFFSMKIFHTWEKCRLAHLKNSFYLLIFSTKNKTVSTITFNFLWD